MSTAISLPGRFLVLVPEERGVSISRRISEARERARLKSVVNLMKPPGIGLIIRTEAKGQGENELFEDFEQLWDRWQTVVSEGEASIGPTLIYRDQDLLFRVIRDAYSHDVSEIICDTADGQRRAQEYLQGWASKQTRVTFHTGDEPLLVAKGIDREIEAALSDRVELPSGGHLNIQPTEALTVIDVNSGRFTSSRTQAETVRRTNLEASQEIPRQLRLRNIGGMVIVDFIDMDSRKDQQQVLEVFQRVLEEDRAKPQIGQLSDLGLVELTRRRQGQSLRELFTAHCGSCHGMGVIPTLELGSAENRRVISFKSREEELAKGRGKRPVRTAGTVLRAATAANGRIMPTVGEPDEEDALADLPEEILAQLPDELLHKADKAGHKGQFGGYAGSVEGDEAEESEEVEDLTFNKDLRHDFTPKSRIFEETFESEEDETTVDHLSNNISAVEQVYQDMGSRTRSLEKAEAVDEGVDIEDVIVISQGPLDEASSVIDEITDEAEEEMEIAQRDELPSSLETEYDPVTGVYRLKTKNSEENDSAESVGRQGQNTGDEDESRILHTNEDEHLPNPQAATTALNGDEQLTIPIYDLGQAHVGDNDSLKTDEMRSDSSQIGDRQLTGEEEQDKEEGYEHSGSVWNPNPSGTV